MSCHVPFAPTAVRRSATTHGVEPRYDSNPIEDLEWLRVQKRHDDRRQFVGAVEHHEVAPALDEVQLAALDRALEDAGIDLRYQRIVRTRDDQRRTSDPPRQRQRRRAE